MRRDLASLAIVASCAAGLIGWVGVVLTRNSIDVFMQDWAVYYAAGTAAREGKFALLFDFQRFTDYQYATLGPWLIAPPHLHPWLYPPPYLLLLAPLSLLPFAASYASFLLATGAAAVAALAWRGAGRVMDWPRGLMLLVFPATFIDALTGQNALLSTALLVGGVRLLERAPAWAGAVLGLLAYKPQLFLLVPVALIAARAWRALAAAALAAAALVLASAAVFSLPSWLLWLDEMAGAETPAYAAWRADTFLRGYSLDVCASLLGLPGPVAMAAQIAASLAAAASVWWVWRRPGAAEARLAVLLVASIVATPHLQAYDMVPLAAALILMFRVSGIGLGEFVLFAAVWLLPLLRPFNLPSGAILVPAVLAALLVYAMARARA
ncbi:MAG TPA: glycosyltransferase 87 family protein [Stellaceae bacterium]|nr:glycosyltransferase 87 family protein [Stellaceae bacterium]